MKNIAYSSRGYGIFMLKAHAWESEIEIELDAIYHLSDVWFGLL